MGDDYVGVCEACGLETPCSRCSGHVAHKATVTFVTQADYDKFVELMQDAEEEGLIQNPFTIQKYTITSHQRIWE